MDQKHPHGRGEDLKSTKKSAQARETPPRAWGRRAVPALAVAVSGNTPTGVGKTVASAATSGLGRKHPHGRGEDSPCGASSPDRCETPPRAWGRQSYYIGSHQSDRNTPTGVGKTPCRPSQLHQMQKHPHGRGEDFHCVVCSALYEETPHGRGEDLAPLWETHNLIETPPRAWGRLLGPDDQVVLAGNTPTGVGKTVSGVTGSFDMGKHPHGRGEDIACLRALACRIETPPRAWGRHQTDKIPYSIPGNTPTGVGKTSFVYLGEPFRRKHPHGRGEDATARPAVHGHGETPPRAWGRPGSSS